MTGPEHYREAERLLELIQERETTPEGRAELIAEAQVHATLALAAATAMRGNAGGMARSDFKA